MKHQHKTGCLPTWRIWKTQGTHGKLKENDEDSGKIMSIAVVFYTIVY